jgi:hypothetical protein
MWRHLIRDFIGCAIACAAGCGAVTDPDSHDPSGDDPPGDDPGTDAPNQDQRPRLEAKYYAAAPMAFTLRGSVVGDYRLVGDQLDVNISELDVSHVMTSSSSGRRERGVPYDPSKRPTPHRKDLGSR